MLICDEGSWHRLPWLHGLSTGWAKPNGMQWLMIWWDIWTRTRYGEDWLTWLPNQSQQKESTWTDLSFSVSLDGPIATSFQESKPRVLAEMQKTHWAPLLVWLQEAYGIHLRVHEDSIVYSKQSPETHSKLRALVAQFDPLKLAGKSSINSSTSFCFHSDHRPPWPILRT
jgi:hypothetical protein